MPRRLPDELLEEVLLRLPPENPAGLVRAGLVCTRWCRLVSAPGFRRRFREFHRSPPMLGMLCNTWVEYKVEEAQFIPTTPFCTPRTDFEELRVLDVRHGRVLFRKGCRVLVVWDPITNEVRELPLPMKRWVGCRNAAILCSAAACNHLDCYHGPFLVVFVYTNQSDDAIVYTYSSDNAAWSEPVIGQGYIFGSCIRSGDYMGSALVGNALYFLYHDYDEKGSTILKYNFELRQRSWIQLPSSLSLLASLPVTTADAELGLVNIDDSRLYMWSRKDTNEVDAIWEKRVVIQLNTVFPAEVEITKPFVIASGFGIIFIGMCDEGDAVYTIDLKTYKGQKVYKGTPHTVIPYMSFYTPALKAGSSGEEAAAGGSSA